ncbi:esterase-like activity of phytase family protein [Oxalobacteraceae bacterium OTU3CINTB1]|nr:esterase-like activity of phytase family protein [Oxalobacteraceae bacterium OTU3CINTB1]
MLTRAVIAVVCAGALLGGCAALQLRDAQPVAGLRFIGEQRIPHRLVFQGTLVGGLSSIDYDSRSGTWIAASDDRSELGPARFYTARLDYDARGFRAIKLESVHTFQQIDGSVYPALKDAGSRGGEVADIEAIRFDPQGDSIWYASEGSDALAAGPFVKQSGGEGGYRSSLPLPDMFKAARDKTAGPRGNLSIEALAFAPDGQSLWVGMEAPLYQDGALASPERGAVSRFTRFDRYGKVLAQYAYPVDRVQGRPAPGRFGDNGVSEMLVADSRYLLALERSGVQDAAGRFAFFIRLYLVDLHGATDIAAYPTLDGAAYAPLKKHLLMDFNRAGLDKVDNLEGMSWGPMLANGHRSLVLISDDNFSADEVTQLLAFEVLPGKEF